MKTIILTFIGILIGIHIGKVSQSKNQVDLPKDYKLINENSKLTGYFTKDSILVIRFYETPDDVYQFEWEGIGKDIPETGENIQISGKDGNIIYLSAIDE